MFYEDERALLSACLANLVRYAGANERFASTVGRWLHGNEAAAGVVASRFTSRAGKGDGETFRPVSDDAWRTLETELREAAAVREAAPGPVDRNLRALSEALALDAAEAAVLRAACWYGYRASLARLFDAVLRDRLLDSEELLAVALGLDVADVWRATGRDGLARHGVLGRYVDDPDDFSFWVPHRLRVAVFPPSDGLADVQAGLIGAPQAASLAWEDFDHDAAARDFIRDVLRGALDRREPGVNILLYGPPGAGKTELCRTVAAELGCALFAPGEADDDGAEPTRAERLGELVMAQTFLASRPRALMLFDEMEDLIRGGEAVTGEGRRFRRAGSKVFLNRLLERNPVPMLWTSNDKDCFDPALLRRMTFIHEMKAPTRHHRERQWSRMLDRFPTPAANAADLARRFEFTPGLAAGAVRAAALADADGARLGLALGAVSRVLDKPAAAASDGGAFEPELARADVDVPDLLDRLSRHGVPLDFSLCLYGPPGTGKSALARAVADRLGIETLQLRASDLLSKWIGESEQKIAAAFEKARAERVFLILDEADSLLSDRAAAAQSWQVSQVNEMLTWMERHPLPFACSTNLMDRLDPASLRRFTFKVRFDYLDAPRIDLAYRRFFGRAAPDSARRLTRLTPGDFAVVAKRLRFMPEADDAAIAALLAAECTLKPGAVSRIGF